MARLRLKRTPHGHGWTVVGDWRFILTRVWSAPGRVPVLYRLDRLDNGASIKHVTLAEGRLWIAGVLTMEDNQNGNVR